MIAKYFTSAFLSLLCTALNPNHAFAQFGAWFGGGPAIENIDTGTLSKMLAEQRKAETIAKESGATLAPADFVLVDVRSDAEVNVSVIPGAITKAQFEKDRRRYADRLVIPYCTVGVRSGAYAKRLAKDGMKVKNYKGSILKWVDAGLPVRTLQGKPTNRVHTYSNRYRVPENYEQVTQ